MRAVAGGRLAPAGRVIRALVVGIAIVATGALLFGLWHVVVGGVVHGNGRAAAFGITLAAAAAVVLLLTAAGVRRSRSGSGRRAARGG